MFNRISFRKKTRLNQDTTSSSLAGATDADTPFLYDPDKPSPLAELPTEVLVHIINDLPIRAKQSLACTNRKLNAICNSEVDRWLKPRKETLQHNLTFLNQAKYIAENSIRRTKKRKQSALSISLLLGCAFISATLFTMLAASKIAHQRDSSAETALLFMLFLVSVATFYKGAQKMRQNIQAGNQIKSLEKTIKQTDKNISLSQSILKLR